MWKKLNFYEQAIRSKDILQFVQHTMTVGPANLKSDCPGRGGGCSCSALGTDGGSHFRSANSA